VTVGITPSEEDRQRMLAEVLCALGLCRHDHAPQHYRRALGVAMRVAGGCDETVARAALSDVYLRLKRTFEEGQAPVVLTSARGFGYRALQRAVLDLIRGARRRWDQVDGVPVEHRTDLAMSEPPRPGLESQRQCDERVRAWRQELTRMMYAGEQPACSRHPSGCPHPELVYSLAFGTLVVEHELVDLDGLTTPSARRASVLSAASPAQFSRPAGGQTGGQRQAGSRLWRCRTELLRSVCGGLRGAA
jgi:hypothetical protein